MALARQLNVQAKAVAISSWRSQGGSAAVDLEIPSDSRYLQDGSVSLANHVASNSIQAAFAQIRWAAGTYWRSGESFLAGLGLFMEIRLNEFPTKRSWPDSNIQRGALQLRTSPSRAFNIELESC